MLDWVPATIPLPRHVPLSWEVLVFAFASSVLAAILFGLTPAFMVSGASVHGSLQEGGRRGTVDGSHRIQRFFVTAEFALALVLLVGAGLLIRSFGKLLAARPGFQPDHLLTLNIPLPRQAYPKATEITDFYKQLLHRVSNLPGVESAGLSSDLPLHAREGISMIVEGETTRNAIVQSWVLGPYFNTMGIPLVEGRWFTPEDRQGSQPVVVVSLSTARKFWPGKNAVGKRIKWGVYTPWDTVIGVVGNVSQGPLSQSLAPHVYRPYRQALAGLVEEDPFGDMHSLNLAVRTHMEPASLAPTILAQVHSLDPDLAVANIRTMTQVIRSSLASPQFDTVLLGIFAGLAMFLAAIGVYGVLAYTVAQRTHEIGIRMALGANRAEVLRMVLRQGTFMVATGMVIGWAGSLVVTRYLRSLLYDVKPTDPATFVAVSLVLVGVALAACYLPARRAANVDPMVALRQE
jgi:putative ABC transport system permease protein